MRLRWSPPDLANGASSLDTALADRLRESLDARRLGAVEADALDVGLELGAIGGGVGGGVGVASEELRGHGVDAHVGALRRQDGGDEELDVAARTLAETGERLALLDPDEDVGESIGRADQALLPRAEVGDLVAVFCAGASGASASALC